MRTGGAGKRRDGNEPAIVAALEAIGAQVWRLHEPGVGDLLVRWRGQLFCFEVKGPNGRLTHYQGAFPVCRTAEDALRYMGAM